MKAQIIWGQKPTYVGPHWKYLIIIPISQLYFETHFTHFNHVNFGSFYFSNQISCGTKSNELQKSMESILLFLSIKPDISL